MLILSRKVGQQIMIGDGIRVVVSRVSGDRVTLGLEAPADVKILRGELRDFDKPVGDPELAGQRAQRGVDRRQSPSQPEALRRPR